MKVAIFEAEHLELELKINKWLVDHPEIEILKIRQSNQKDLKTTISIWFK